MGYAMLLMTSQPWLAFIVSFTHTVCHSPIHPMKRI